jgi:hypothetical protein
LLLLVNSTIITTVIHSDEGNTVVKRKILVAAAILAAMLTSAGVAVAATTVVRPSLVTSGRMCVASNGVLKLAANNGSCAAGTQAETILAKGFPGVALGYAHILPGGAFDASRSFNVNASNVVSTKTGFYCFRGLSFNPHNASLTYDYNGTQNGQIPSMSLRLPATQTSDLCGLASAQAIVFTGLVNITTKFTAGAKFGFYVVFY